MSTDQHKAHAAHVLGKVVTILSDVHGVDPEFLEKAQKNTRFAWPEMSIDIGEPLPESLGPFLAFDAFEGSAHDPLGAYLPGDIRIYCLPLMQGMPYMRIKFNRDNPTGTRVKFWDEDSFVAEVAAEWNAIVEALSDDEDDDSVECLECKMFTEVTVSEDDERDTPDPVFCGNCGTRLPVQAVPV
jgi:hypothetical protein